MRSSLVVLLVGASLCAATTGKLEFTKKNWNPDQEEGFQIGDLNPNPWENVNSAEDILAAQARQQKLNMYSSLPTDLKTLVHNELEEATDPALKTQREAARRMAELNKLMGTEETAEVEALPMAAESEVAEILGDDDTMLNNFLEKKWDAQDTIDAQAKTQTEYSPWVPGLEFERKKEELAKRIENNPSLKTFLDQQDHMRQVQEAEKAHTISDFSKETNATSLIVAKAESSSDKNPALSTYQQQINHQKAIEEAAITKNQERDAIAVATATEFLQADEYTSGAYPAWEKPEEVDLAGVHRAVGAPNSPDEIVAYQQKMLKTNIPWYPHIEDDIAKSKLDMEEAVNPAQATIAQAQRRMKDLNGQWAKEHPESTLDYPALHYDATHTWEDSHPQPEDWEKTH